MRMGRILTAFVAMIGGAGPVMADESVAEALHRLFQDRLEWQLRESPEQAMARGDYRYADHITDNSLAGIERRHHAARGHLDRLLALDRAKLSAEDQLNYDLFEWLLRSEIERHRFRAFVTPIGGRWGLQLEVPQM